MVFNRRLCGQSFVPTNQIADKAKYLHVENVKWYWNIYFAFWVDSSVFEQTALSQKESAYFLWIA